MLIFFGPLWLIISIYWIGQFLNRKERARQAKAAAYQLELQQVASMPDEMKEAYWRAQPARVAADVAETRRQDAEEKQTNMQTRWTLIAIGGVLLIIHLATH